MSIGDWWVPVPHMVLLEESSAHCSGPVGAWYENAGSLKDRGWRVVRWAQEAFTETAPMARRAMIVFKEYMLVVDPKIADMK